MFGIMRPEKACSANAVDSSYQYHRMHYCGTCKAIGHNFDHRSRMMLNFDTVFLSELLSQLDKVELENWEDNLKKVNTCFSMPKNEALPFSLNYAATASVLLSELKVDDNIKDSRRSIWKLAKRIYSASFKKAALQFQEWGIDTSDIYHLIDQQAERECTPTRFDRIEACLDHYADATAQITATVFAEGGKRLKNEVDLQHLGYQFGKLMYILDAFEDYEMDVFKGQFNPLAVFWGKDRSLNNSKLEQIRSLILSLQNEVNNAIGQLPVAEAYQQIYQDRLKSNLALRLYKEREIPHTFKERIAMRWNFAKDFASQVTCQPQSWIRQMNYYMIVLAVFISPQTTEYLPEDGKMEVFKWATFITATLATFGLAGVIRRKSKKERRKEKKQKKKLKRFFMRLKRSLFSKNTCCQGCLSACCNGCCESCCDSICESDNPWLWVLIFTAIALTTALVVLILYLAGVL
ncbi:MAG: DUF5685 family protein [Saprospiraceae bacterium]|nr:DUF5685 family protein [Saprospiraceae bacterium]